MGLWSKQSPEILQTKTKKKFQKFSIYAHTKFMQAPANNIQSAQWALPTQHLCDFFPVRYWSIPNPNAYI